MLDIPPEDEALKDIDKIKFNVRTRIKLFYRPKNLKISPTKKAYEELQFKLVNKNEIEVNNPTPYFITLTNIDDVNQQTNYLNKAVVLESFDNKKLI